MSGENFENLTDEELEVNLTFYNNLLKQTLGETDGSYSEYAINMIEAVNEEIQRRNLQS